MKILKIHFETTKGSRDSGTDPEINQSEWLA